MKNPESSHPAKILWILHCASGSVQNDTLYSKWRGALKVSHVNSASLRSLPYRMRWNMRCQRVWSKKWTTMCPIKASRSPIEVLSI